MEIINTTSDKKSYVSLEKILIKGKGFSIKKPRIAPGPEGEIYE